MRVRRAAAATSRNTASSSGCSRRTADGAAPDPVDQVVRTVPASVRVCVAVQPPTVVRRTPGAAKPCSAAGSAGPPPPRPGARRAMASDRSSFFASPACRTRARAVDSASRAAGVGQPTTTEASAWARDWEGAVLAAVGATTTAGSSRASAGPYSAAPASPRARAARSTAATSTCRKALSATYGTDPSAIASA